MHIETLYQEGFKILIVCEITISSSPLSLPTAAAQPLLFLHFLLPIVLQIFGCFWCLNVLVILNLTFTSKFFSNLGKTISKSLFLSSPSFFFLEMRDKRGIYTPQFLLLHLAPPLHSFKCFFLPHMFSSYNLNHNLYIYFNFPLPSTYFISLI